MVPLDQVPFFAEDDELIDALGLSARMTVWLWAFSVGLAGVFAALAALSIYVAACTTAAPPRLAAPSRINPYPVTVVHAEAKRRRRIDDRDQAS